MSTKVEYLLGKSAPRGKRLRLAEFVEQRVSDRG